MGAIQRTISSLRTYDSYLAWGAKHGRSRRREALLRRRAERTSSWALVRPRQAHGRLAAGNRPPCRSPRSFSSHPCLPSVIAP